MKSFHNPQNVARRWMSVFVCATCALFVSASPAFPEVTWDGGAATNNWLDGANWSTNTIPVSGDGSVSITTGADVFLAGAGGSVTSSGGRLLTLSGNSSLDVQTGGSLQVFDPVVNAGSTLSISGGSLTYYRVSSIAGKILISSGTLTGTAASNGQISETEVSGGTWNLNADTTFGRNTDSLVSVSDGAIVASGKIISGYGGHTNSTDFVLTGGSISSAVFQQGIGTVNVSGGSFSTSGNYDWSGTLAGTSRVLRVTGGAGALSVGGNFVTTGSTGVRDFVLTAKNFGVTQENISTLLVTGTDSAGGDVDASLQGGILLGNPTTYDLISAGTLGGSLTYVGTDLYDGAASGNSYQLTLDGTRDVGGITLVTPDTPVSDSFSLTTVGYVDMDLTGVIGGSPTLLVRLDADAGAGTMAGLTAYLAQSGYSNVMEDVFGAYDISFEIDGAFLSNGTMYLGWDFTEYDSGAGLQGLQVTAVPEPGTAWMVFAASLSFLLWRCRRSQGNAWRVQF